MRQRRARAQEAAPAGERPRIDSSPATDDRGSIVLEPVRRGQTLELLVAVASGERIGKLERKRYGDGTQRLKVGVRKLELAGRVTLLAKVAGRTIAEVLVTEGSGKFDEEGVSVPELTAGETVELYHGDVVVAFGKLELD